MPTPKRWNRIWSANIQALDELNLAVMGAVGWGLVRSPSGRLYRPGSESLKLLRIQGIKIGWDRS